MYLNDLQRRFLIMVHLATLACFIDAEEIPQKVAIIKADDIRGVTATWDRFFALSEEKGVKVSAGIICQSLQGEKPAYFKWLKTHHRSGNVEFWNHGWDHKRWTTEDGKELREFSGTGYEHQKKHFDQSQALMKNVLGVAPVAFGAPYNAMDADTVKVLNEDPAMRLVFCYGNKTIKNKRMAPMRLRGESDGTGKPNFEKFKAEYAQKKNLSFTVIQFHPNNFREEHFAEYARILDFLIELEAPYTPVIIQAGRKADHPTLDTFMADVLDNPLALLQKPENPPKRIRSRQWYYLSKTM